jgi:3-methyladenine DNA glycosylase AlkC
VQVAASLQAAQPAGQAEQAVSVVALQAAFWYCPAAQVAQALQTTPSPVNPGLQAQLKLPALFVQFALAEQLDVPAAHSSMSAQPPAPPPV